MLFYSGIKTNLMQMNANINIGKFWKFTDYVCILLCIFVIASSKENTPNVNSI